MCPGVFFDIVKSFLHDPVQVKLVFGLHNAKVEVLLHGGEAFDSRPFAEGGAKACKGVFEGKPGKIRRHKLGTDLTNPGTYDRLLADNSLFFRRFAPGSGKKPQFGKYRVMEFAGDAPPFSFLSCNHQPGKGKILGFPFLRSAYAQIEITDEGCEEKHDDHKKPEEAEINLEFGSRYRYHTSSVYYKHGQKGNLSI
jgi:hypothetical protein